MKVSVGTIFTVHSWILGADDVTETLSCKEQIGWDGNFEAA